VYKKNNQKGFTLIELLIVIVIIGILAGVLIAIIDPGAQQNRARDAGVQASINKIALATQGFVSAYGDTPEGDEFLGSLDNVTDALPLDCLPSQYECTFDVTGNELRTTLDTVGSCSAADQWTWDAGGTRVNCQYYYQGNLGTGNDFRICAVAHGMVDGTFCFESAVGYMAQCEGDGTVCVRIGT